MNKVLIVAYEFPPAGGVGVLRTLKFVKYLPQFGWQPVVLTVAHSEKFVTDETLLREIDPSIPVYRARSWEPLNVVRMKRAADRIGGGIGGGSGGGSGGGNGSAHALKSRLKAQLRNLYFAVRIPDDKIGWFPFAASTGRKILQEHAIDLIFASSPPYTNLLVGRALKKMSGLPLVLDYRDEWSTLQYSDRPTNPVSHAIQHRLEKSVLRQADAVVAASAPIPQHLDEANLLPPTTATQTIMNGFDPDDYRGSSGAKEPDHFTITYTGSFYGQRQTPEYFLAALAQVLNAQPAWRENVRVRFVGSIFPAHREFIDIHGLADVVELLGIVPHQEATAHQLGADVLLLIVGNGPGSDTVLTGKIFEYLGANRPILALTPLHGPAAALIQEAGAGPTVDPEDVAGIARSIETLYRCWEQQRPLPTPRRAVAERFSRYELTRELVALFERLQPRPHAQEVALA